MTMDEGPRIGGGEGRWDGESFEASLDAIVRGAEDLLDRPYLVDWTTRGDDDQEYNVELIESPEFVTALVDAPGFREKDFVTKSTEEELTVLGPTFKLKKALPCKVVAGETDSSYRNGILSVRMPKP